MAEKIIDRLIAIFSFKTEEQELDKIDKQLKRIGKQLDKLGNRMLGVGAALTAGAGLSLKGFASYESNLAKIEGLVGVSRKEIDGWDKDLKRISRDSGKSLGQVSEAMFFVTSAGYRGSEELEILERTAIGSAAGLGEQATLADLVTSSLGVYADGSLTATAAMDQLTAAIREGKLEPASLSGALANVLPIAKNVGVEFGEVAGTMAALSRQGVAANRSATALRGIFAKIIKPTEQGRKELAKYGLSYEGLRKTVSEKGLLQALIDLDKAFDGNTESMSRVFEDVEALSGVLGVLGGDLTETDRIIRDVSNASGTLDSAMRPVADTLEFRLQQALSNFGVKLAEVGEQLKPTAIALIEFSTNALDAFDSLGDAGTSAIAIFLALGPLIFGVGGALKFASFALSGYVPLVKAATFWSGALATSSWAATAGKYALATATGIATKAMKIFNFIIGKNPIVFIIVTAISALLFLIAYWDEVSAAVKRFGDWAGKIFSKIGTAIGNLIAYIGDNWQTLLWNLLLPWRILYIRIPKMIMKMITNLIGRIAKNWGKAWGFLTAPFAAAFNWIKNTFGKVVDDVKKRWGRFWKNVTGQKAEIEADIKDPGKKTIATFGEGVKDAGPELAEDFEKAFEPTNRLLPQSDAEEGPFSRLTESGEALMKTFAQGVEKGARSFTNMIMKAFGESADEPMIQNLSTHLLDPDILNMAQHMGSPLPVGRPITEIRMLESQNAAAINQSSRSIDVNVENRFEISNEGDPDEIVDRIASNLEDQLRRAAEQFDSDVQS